MNSKPDESKQDKDPDPWCEEGDGEYEPPAQPEVTSTATADYSPDRWNV